MRRYDFSIKWTSTVCWHPLNFLERWRANKKENGRARVKETNEEKRNRKKTHIQIIKWARVFALPLLNIWIYSHNKRTKTFRESEEFNALSTKNWITSFECSKTWKQQPWRYLYFVASFFFSSMFFVWNLAVHSSHFCWVNVVIAKNECRCR